MWCCPCRVVCCVVLVYLCVTGFSSCVGVGGVVLCRCVCVCVCDLLIFLYRGLVRAFISSAGRRCLFQAHRIRANTLFLTNKPTQKHSARAETDSDSFIFYRGLVRAPDSSAGRRCLFQPHRIRAKAFFLFFIHTEALAQRTLGGQLWFYPFRIQRTGAGC